MHLSRSGFHFFLSFSLGSILNFYRSDVARTSVISVFFSSSFLISRLANKKLDIPLWLIPCNSILFVEISNYGDIRSHLCTRSTRTLQSNYSFTCRHLVRDGVTSYQDIIESMTVFPFDNVKPPFDHLSVPGTPSSIIHRALSHPSLNDNPIRRKRNPRNFYISAVIHPGNPTHHLDPRTQNTELVAVQIQQTDSRRTRSKTTSNYPKVPRCRNDNFPSQTRNVDNASTCTTSAFNPPAQ